MSATFVTSVEIENGADNPAIITGTDASLVGGDPYLNGYLGGVLTAGETTISYISGGIAQSSTVTNGVLKVSAGAGKGLFVNAAKAPAAFSTEYVMVDSVQAELHIETGLIVALSDYDDVVVGSRYHDDFLIHNVAANFRTHDTISGGGGEDLFEFKFSAGSNSVTHIADFDGDDMLTFQFVDQISGTYPTIVSEFTGSMYQIRYYTENGKTYFEFDADGDFYAENIIIIEPRDFITRSYYNGLENRYQISSYYWNSTVSGDDEDNVIDYWSDTTSNFDLRGYDGNDTLVGNHANNLIDGGAGADIMIGGGFGDTYIVDNVGDVVIEEVDDGAVDQIIASVTFTLASNVEQMTLVGVRDIDGFGNDLANMIWGNEAHNRLSGGAGDDILYGNGGDDVLAGGVGRDQLHGGGGNDIYVIDSADDMIVEAADGGTQDRVEASISYTIGGHIENLTLTATAAINGRGNAQDNIIRGNEAANQLGGLEGHDTLNGLGGDDLLSPGTGSNIVDGGVGFDTLLLDGVKASYSYLSAGGSTLIIGEEGATRIVDVEQVQFANAALATGDLAASLTAFDGLRYVAGYVDLIVAIGTDATVAASHYAAFGFTEGRDAKEFDPLDYVAGYEDLIGAFGTDVQAATRHYLSFGYGEGRSDDRFDGLQYVASYDDLIGAIGADAESAARHYIRFGRGEGRAADMFDGLRYIASNPDLIVAIGDDDDGAASHYIRFGRGEGRDVDGFDALAYGAANADLAVAFGQNVDALTRHYIDYGYYEHRNLGVPVNVELFLAA